VLRTQAIHPWDHGIQASLPWDVAFNTAVSFVSNTSWQFYAGETSLRMFSQVASIALHSWLFVPALLLGSGARASAAGCSDPSSRVLDTDGRHRHAALTRSRLPSVP
jgi:hypothetical protein